MALSGAATIVGFLVALLASVAGCKLRAAGRKDVLAGGDAAPAFSALLGGDVERCCC